MAKVGRASRNASLMRVETLGSGTDAPTAKVIGDAETGEVYFIDHNHASALNVTLPAMKAGAYFKFIWITDMTAAGTVVFTSADTTDGDFFGAVLEQVTGGSDAATAMVVCPDDDDTLTINDDVDPGSWLEVVCDGEQWHWTGVISVDAVGKAVFS